MCAINQWLTCRLSCRVPIRPSWLNLNRDLSALPTFIARVGRANHNQNEWETIEDRRRNGTNGTNELKHTHTQKQWKRLRQSSILFCKESNFLPSFSICPIVEKERKKKKTSCASIVHCCMMGPIHLSPNRVGASDYHYRYYNRHYHPKRIESDT